MGFLSNFFGGGPKTTVVQSKIPEELAPYVTEVNKEQQELYRRRLAETPETYQYQGQTIADLTKDQQDARSGIRGLVGSTADDYALARQGITGGDEKFKTDISPERIDALQRGDYSRIDPTVAARSVDFTGAPTGFTSERFQEKDISEYMNPYQRAVTDIEKRKAQEDFAKLMPEFEKQAVSMGGMSGMGSRAGVQAGLMGQQQMQRLGDLEKTGLLEAYQDAQSRKAEDFDRFRDQRSFEERERSFLKGERDYLTGLDIGNIDRQRGERAFNVGFDRDQQGFLKGERDFEKGERAFEASQFADRKKRERQQAQDLQSLAKSRYGQEMKEFGALETLGANAEKRAQRGLDRSYADWLERRERPETLLGRYTSAIYGNPMLAQPTKVKTEPGIPFGQQLMGFGTALAGAGGLNPFFKAGGGQVVDSGISSLVPKPVIYRQTSGSLSIDRIKELDRLEALKSLALKRKMGKEKFGVKAIEKPPPLLGPEKITPGGVKYRLPTVTSVPDPKEKGSGVNLISSASAATTKPLLQRRTTKADNSNQKAVKGKGEDQSAGTSQKLAPYAGTSALPALTPNSRSGRGELSSDFIRGMERLQQSQKDQKDKLTEIQSMNTEEKIKQRFAEDQTARRATQTLLTGMTEKNIQELKDVFAKYGKKREGISPLVYIGTAAAQHKDGFFAGAAEGLQKWAEANDVNEKDFNKLQMKIAEAQYKLGQDAIKDKKGILDEDNRLTKAMRDEIRNLPKEQLAVMNQLYKNDATIIQLKIELMKARKTKKSYAGRTDAAFLKRLQKIPNVYKAVGIEANVANKQSYDNLKGQKAIDFDKIGRQVQMYIAALAEDRGGDKGSGDMKRIEIEVLEGIDKNPILLNHIRSNY